MTPHWGDARFARADEEGGFLAVDEGAGGEVDDAGLGELRAVGEVEALEGGLTVELGAAQAQTQLLAVAALDLVHEEAQEELVEGEVVVDGLATADVEGLEQAGEAQFLEDGHELIGGCHRVLSWRFFKSSWGLRA